MRWQERQEAAVVAAARKLAILLHRLWVTGEVYEPLRNNQAWTTGEGDRGGSSVKGIGF